MLAGARSRLGLGPGARRSTARGRLRPWDAEHALGDEEEGDEESEEDAGEVRKSGTVVQQYWPTLSKSPLKKLRLFCFVFLI